METIVSSNFQINALINLVMAMILGGLIGIDREYAEKPAGLRTHILVSGAAALIVVLGEATLRHFSLKFDFALVQSDPVRVIAAVITGISFLGAGTILRLRDEEHIEGLTTAASLLFAGGIGISVAFGQWLLGIGATGLVLLTLRVIPFARFFIKKPRKE